MWDDIYGKLGVIAARLGIGRSLWSRKSRRLGGGDDTKGVRIDKNGKRKTGDVK